MIQRCALSAMAAAALVAVTGCGSFGDFTTFYLPRGDLQLRSVDPENDVAIDNDFDIALYAVENTETAHVLLIQGTEAAPRQVVHIKMFWRPRAGRTPFDPTATNTTVRYVLFDGDQVALFGGGGLLRPHDLPGDEKWAGTLYNATLRLLDQTDDFDAGLGDSAIAVGTFKATRDELRTLELLRKMTAVLEDKLGYPRLVGMP